MRGADSLRTVRDGLTIAFDADDTLWHNEDAFERAEHQFNDLVSPWADATEAQRVLVDVERDQVGTYGYGVKSFALAMIRAACQISNDEIPAVKLRTIVDTATELLSMPTVLIDGAADVIGQISERYPTMIITKGDLHHQLRRIDQADVAKHCFDIEVVADKDARTYRRILERHNIEPANIVMVGNSIVSDVAPILEIGGRAVHIPYQVTWALETTTQEPAPSDRWARLESITELPDLLETFS